MEFLLIWMLFGLVTAVAASSRGRGGCGWFIMGVLLGPFGLILVLVMPKVELAVSVDHGPSPDTHLRCPDCAELVLRQARKCKHCGCALKPD